MPRGRRGAKDKPVTLYFSDGKGGVTTKTYKSKWDSEYRDAKSNRGVFEDKTKATSYVRAEPTGKRGMWGTLVKDLGGMATGAVKKVISTAVRAPTQIASGLVGGKGAIGEADRAVADLIDLVSDISDPTKAAKVVQKDLMPGLEEMATISSGLGDEGTTESFLDRLERGDLMDVLGAVGSATGTTGDTTGGTGAIGEDVPVIGEESDIIADEDVDPLTGEQLSTQARYRRNRLRGAQGIGGTRKTGGRGIQAAGLSLAKNVLLGG